MSEFVTPLAELRSQLDESKNLALTDSDCERFLVARHNNIKNTLEMVNHWYDWYHLPLIPATTTSNSGKDEELRCPKDILHPIEDKNEAIYQQLLPHSNLGEDKEGRPIYWERTGEISSNFHKVKKLLTENDLFVRHIRQQEMVALRLRQLSIKHNHHIGKQILVYDLKNLSFSIDFMALRTFRRTLSIDEACYPERLYRLLLINAPSFFSMCWSMIHSWIDPVTAEKIQIIGSNYLPVLRQYMDDDQIPIEYGGTRSDFSWQWPDNCAMDLSSLS